MSTSDQDQILVIDNFIPIEQQEQIKNLLYGMYFPWYFIQDVSLIGNEQRRFAASHWFVSNGDIISQEWNTVKSLAVSGAMIYGYPFNGIENARTFLQYPLNPNVLGNGEIDKFHVDMTYKKHLVVLYYVNDSDGNTVITDKKHQLGEPELNGVFDEYKIIKSIEPKQGRAVIFDGFYYHTAEQPQSNMRCVINFNIV